jgi:hypothetical protein
MVRCAKCDGYGTVMAYRPSEPISQTSFLCDCGAADWMTRKPDPEKMAGVNHQSKLSTFKTWSDDYARFHGLVPRLFTAEGEVQYHEAVRVWQKSLPKSRPGIESEASNRKT